MLPDDLKDYYAREKFDYLWAVGAAAAGGVLVFVAVLLVLALEQVK